jgi:hypothetical protein
VPVWVSACFNFDGFVFLLLTLLAWLLCVAVFLPVAIIFLLVSWSDGLWVCCWGSLVVPLFTCSLVAWFSPCWIAVLSADLLAVDVAC